MGLSAKTKRWLEEFDSPEYTNAIRSSQASTAEHLRTLGISLESDIADFYLNYGAGAALGWYELLEPRELEEYNPAVLDNLDLPNRFLALTSQEGSGVSLLDRNSGFIYDVVFADIEDLKHGTIEPVAHSFSDYLDWRRSKLEPGD